MQRRGGLGGRLSEGNLPGKWVHFSVRHDLAFRVGLCGFPHPVDINRNLGNRPSSRTLTMCKDGLTLGVALELASLPDALTGTDRFLL